MGEVSPLTKEVLIAIGVGGGLLGLGVIALIVWLCRRRRNNKDVPPEGKTYS